MNSLKQTSSCVETTLYSFCENTTLIGTFANDVTLVDFEISHLDHLREPQRYRTPTTRTMYKYEEYLVVVSIRRTNIILRTRCIVGLRNIYIGIENCRGDAIQPPKGIG